MTLGVGTWQAPDPPSCMSTHFTLMRGDGEGALWHAPCGPLPPQLLGRGTVSGARVLPPAHLGAWQQEKAINNLPPGEELVGSSVREAGAGWQPLTTKPSNVMRKAVSVSGCIVAVVSEEGESLGA